MKNEAVKNKHLILMELGRDYRQILLQHKLNQIQANNKKVGFGEQQFLLYIQLILEELNDDYRRIIYHDYLTNSDKYWYLEYYQKSTYYKLRTRAIEEFIRCLRI